MAGISSRDQFTFCTFCGVACKPAHCRITVRRADGSWRCLYKLCWDCGYEELQWARRQQYYDNANYLYEYIEVQA